MPATIFRAQGNLSAPGTAPKLADTATGLLALYRFDTLDALADGAEVTAVPNQASGAASLGSAADLNVVHATATKRPTLKRALANGHHALHFTRANAQYIRTAVLPSAVPQPATLVAVFKREVTTGAGHLSSGGVVSSVSKALTFDLESTTNTLRMNTVPLGTSAQLGTVDTALHVGALVFNGASSRLHLDGDQVAAPGISPSADACLPQITLGANQSTSGQYMDGDVVEWRLYGRALSALDVAALRADLVSRYSLP